MVTSLGESLDAAARIASQIAANAISDAGRCTWVREQSVNQSGRWTTEARTLDASIASGTAGIGWLLAVLGQITGEGRLERRAVEALRASIDRADALVTEKTRLRNSRDGAPGKAIGPQKSFSPPRPEQALSLLYST